jgi:hypothetical protein
MYVPNILFSDPILSTLFSSTCKNRGGQKLKSAIWFWVRQRNNFWYDFSGTLLTAMGGSPNFEEPFLFPYDL